MERDRGAAFLRRDTGALNAGCGCLLLPAAVLCRSRRPEPACRAPVSLPRYTASRSRPLSTTVWTSQYVRKCRKVSILLTPSLVLVTLSIFVYFFFQVQGGGSFVSLMVHVVRTEGECILHCQWDRYWHWSTRGLLYFRYTSSV
ncbi:hypothetical protein Y032_0207g2009 [Ancylostoma ceylanicum]|uniref:Uncharacterized protein n=1 Tax=Ancylostoma ceylanicum TaxID=53326 RepID=A0A016SKQ6_9BILA|nr:hypothetical protein Y032_0207g2009 [Ancylostoma ceylanicum]